MKAWGPLLDPQQPQKMPSDASPVIPALGKQRQGDPGVCLPVGLATFISSWWRERLCLRKLGGEWERKTLDINIWLLHIHMHRCIWTYIHRRAHTQAYDNLFLYIILYVYSFLLDIFFIYISNGIPFPGFASEIPLSSPLTPAHQTTHSCFFPWESPTMGHRAFTGPRASPPIGDWRDHPLLHMGWNHGSLFGWWFSSYDLWGTHCFILLFLLWGCKPLQLPWYFL